MAKRGNGEGTTYKRKDGRWVSVIPVTSCSGKRSKMYFYGKTRKECVEWRINMLDDIRKNGGFIDAGTTFISWLDKWVQEYCINVRDSTLMNYYTYIQHHIRPLTIAEISLNRLTTHDLQVFINHLLEDGRLDGKGGLSAKTVRNIFNMIHAALKQAVGNKLIFSNPADYVVLPKAEKPNVSFLDLKSQEALLKACTGEKWSIGLVLMLGTGIRIGELLALKQSSLKDDEGIAYLDISKSLQRVTDFENTTKGKTKTILRESETKTENSKRKIPVSPELKIALTKHFEIQNAEIPCNDPYIICNDKGGFIDPTTFRNWFNSVVKKAGLEGKITPHTLRHSFASTALRYGMDLKNISTILGHYSTDFTARTYVHTDLEGQYEAILRMNEKISDSKGVLPC